MGASGCNGPTKLEKPKMTDKEAIASISTSIGIATNDAEHKARMRRAAELDRDIKEAMERDRQRQKEMDERGVPSDWVKTHLDKIARALESSRRWREWGVEKIEGMARATDCPKVEIRIYNDITGPTEVVTIGNPELIEIIDMGNQECIVKMDFLHAKRNMKEWKEREKRK